MFIQAANEFGGCMLYLLIIAGVIILPLALYAAHLLRQVKALKLKQQEAAQLQKQKDQQRIDYITESLRVISLNVLQEDLNLSEATIRCKHLLDGLFLPAEQRQQYQLLDEVFEQIKDFATHKARRSLPKSELRQQDAAREAVEEKYRDQLLVLFTEMRAFAKPLVH